MLFFPRTRKDVMTRQMIATADGFKMAYRIRDVVNNNNSRGFYTTIPRTVVEQAAARQKLTLDEFVAAYCIVHYFDSKKENGATYRFERKNGQELSKDGSE